LAEGASVTTTEPLAADGNITLGKGSSLATTGSGENTVIKGKVTLGEGSSLSVAGDGDIAGGIDLGKDSTLTLSGGGSTITGEVKLAAGSEIVLNLASGTTDIGSATGTTKITGPAAGTPPAEITLSGASGELNLKGSVTAENVKIVSGGDTSKINIPTNAVLTIKNGAILELNDNLALSGQGDTGALSGKVVIENGGTIIDANTNRDAWNTADGILEIRYGGKGQMNPGSGLQTIIGTGPAGPAPSNFVQLAEGAVFTNTANMYEITAGVVTLASNFADNQMITVANGTLILNGDLAFLNPHKAKVAAGTVKGTLAGTLNTSKLRIKGGTKIGILTSQLTSDSKDTEAASLIPGFSFSSGTINLGVTSTPVYAYTSTSDANEYEEYVWNTVNNEWEEPSTP
jgi:hypothetical protein